MINIANIYNRKNSASSHRNTLSFNFLFAEFLLSVDLLAEILFGRGVRIGH